jgi:hypothetical protein
MYILKPDTTHTIDQREDFYGRVTEHEVRIDPEDAFREFRWWAAVDMVQGALLEVWGYDALQRVKALKGSTFERWAEDAAEAFVHVSDRDFHIDAIYQGGRDWDFDWVEGDGEVAFADWLVKRALSA